MDLPFLVPILVGVGLVVLLILCLPFGAIQKLILEVSALVLRLALLAVVGLGAYLGFYPDRFPIEVAERLRDFPTVGTYFPEPGSLLLGPLAAALVVVPLLPVLAVLDVTRKLAGRRLYRLRALSGKPVVVAPPAPAERTVAAPTPAPTPPPPAPPAPPPLPREEIPVPRRTDRRAAADTLASAGSRKPFRYTGPERGRDLPPGGR
jgi:hypothetical protein